MVIRIGSYIEMKKVWVYIKAFLRNLRWMVLLFPIGIWYLHFAQRMSMKDAIVGSIIGGLFGIFVGSFADIKSEKNRD